MEVFLWALVAILAYASLGCFCAAIAVLFGMVEEEPGFPLTTQAWVTALIWPFFLWMCMQIVWQKMFLPERKP